MVYQFLGRSNRLAARADDGALGIDGASFPLARGLPAGPLAAYVRPHDIELLLRPDEPGAIAVTVDEVQVVGPVVRVVVRAAHDPTPIEVDLTRAQLAALDLRPGMQLFARPGLVTAFPPT